MGYQKIGLMSPIPIVIALICVLLSLLYLRWRNVKQYWAVRGVPYTPPHPFFGSLSFLLCKNMGIWLREVYSRFNTAHYRAKYVGLWYFWRPVLMINCPDIARNVLVKDFANFRNRHLSSAANDPIGALNIFAVNDPIWSKVRRRLTPVFSSSKLKQLQSFIQSKSKEIVKRIESEKDNRIDLRSLFSDYTTDVIGTSAFGVVSDATLTGDSPVRAITREFMKFSIYRGISWTSIFFWPEMVNIFGFTFFPKDSSDYFRRIFDTIATQREKDENTRQSKDLMDALLQIKKEDAINEEGFSDDLLIAQGVLFLQAGFDTSASVLTFMFNELAHAPKLQEKVYIELLEARDKNGSDNFDIEVLEGLTYFNCVIKEALRKYPPMGWLDRVAANDYQIDENLSIKAGTPIFVNAIGIHYDPEYFPEPDQFNPDRFLPENEKKIKPYTYMPFGEGPRVCIGMRFAFSTLRHAIAAVMLNYTVEPYPDTPSPSECQIEKRGLGYVPGEIVNIKFIRRSQSNI